jgi:iron complex transport system substrate-binding protein
MPALIDRPVRPAPIVDDTTRREFVISGASLLGLLAVGAGCSDDEGSGTSTTSTADPGGFPRTITHGFGETTIPSKPVRVVATADREQLDVLLAMGITPVQVGRSGDYDPAAPWLDADQVSALEQAEMADAFVPNLELIASARPDLILDTFADQTGYDALAAIAPTVELKVAETDSWEDAQRMAGEATGEDEAAEAAIAETRAVLEEQAATLGGLDGMLTAVAFVQGDQLLVLPGTAIGGRVLAELGLDVLATDSGAGTFYSLEQIPDVLGSVDVVVSYDDGMVEAMAANPLWAALPAVQAKQWAVLSADVAAAAYQESSLSLRWAASRVADAVRAAADGDGRGG